MATALPFLILSVGFHQESHCFQFASANASIVNVDIHGSVAVFEHVPFFWNLNACRYCDQ